MGRVCLAFLRFCLSAWVGIAIFFVMVVMDLRHSELFKPDAKFNHPKVLFPLYYGCEFSLLGTALVCACAAFKNELLGTGRKCALLALIATALSLAAWDYGLIYRAMISMMDSAPLPPEFDGLHYLSRWLNGGVLAATGAAAIAALAPEKTGASQSPLR
ncbi:MAG TPA: hypothetical protein VKU82_16315 [Planctomycetaceae bacterium]|nr:hypothetical protein [Planctomycetaceae bacterium]